LYTITGSNTGGSTNATFTLTVNKGTGINETELISTAIYPNPTTSMVNISSNQAIETIKVFDVTGKIILTIKENALSDDKIQLNLEKVTTGVYFVKISNDDQQVVKRIIKN